MVNSLATGASTKAARKLSLFRRRKASKNASRETPHPNDLVQSASSGSYEQESEGMEMTEESFSDRASPVPTNEILEPQPQVQTDHENEPKQQPAATSPSALSPVIERVDSEVGSTSSQVVSGLLAISSSNKQNEKEPTQAVCMVPRLEEPADKEGVKLRPMKDEASPTHSQQQEQEPQQQPEEPQSEEPVTKEQVTQSNTDNPSSREPAKPEVLVSPPRPTNPSIASVGASPSPLSLSSPQRAQMPPMEEQDENMPAPPQLNEPHVTVSSPTNGQRSVASEPHIPIPPMVVTTPSKAATKIVTANVPPAGSSSPSTAATSSTSSTTEAGNGTLALMQPKPPEQQKSTADLIRTDLWSPDKSVVHNALAQITKEAAVSEKSRSLIARTGGLFAVVKAMETHSTSTDVQISGCHALEKLALDSDNEIAIEQVGGVETILAAMMGHFENAQVQEAAWAALWNLTCSNASKDLTLDADGGMNAVVSAQRAHMNSPGVQKNAMGALANLCQNNPKRMEAFAEADGFVVVATALQKYWSKPDVRSEACRAMTVLCEGFASRSSPLAKSNALTIAPVVSSAANSAIPSTAPTNTRMINTGGGYLPGGYMPHRLGTMAQALNNHGYNGNVASDLQSLASVMSYYDEETVYD